MKVKNSDEVKRIEESLAKFREIKDNISPSASAEQKRFLDEMISIGENSLGALNPKSKTETQKSPFSVSRRRIRETLILFAAVAIIMFFLFYVIGVFQTPR